MKKYVLASVLLCLAVLVQAQPSDLTLVTSTICNEDSTVTFYYQNDHAKEVMVDVQFAGRQPMTRDAETGFWKATLGPAAPDMYPYCFIVDGVSIMDPACEQYFPNEGFKNSLLEIPARGTALAHDIKDARNIVTAWIKKDVETEVGDNKRETLVIVAATPFTVHTYLPASVCNEYIEHPELRLSTEAEE